MDGTVVDATLYGYAVDRWRTPVWAREAVVYQIFVDRFARGSEGAAVADDWLQPAQMTDFMGGDLPGIIARLDYIAGLGVSALWLTPIFLAAEYHAYDTIDYTKIDPRFSTADDLHALVEKAHALGLRVILDFVANHTSDQSPLFQSALADEKSVYRGWFSFGPQFTHGYRCFFDVASMPQFDTDNPAVRRHLCDAASYRLHEFDVDGYRLDYAAGPSHSFWSAFSAACRSAKPNCWLFGEVARAGEVLRTYRGRLDGCMDFDFLRWVRQLCLGEQPAVTLGHFVAHIERTAHFFPPDFRLPAFLDNHDTNRFLWMADNDTARLRLGLALLFGLGGSPILYYRTEVGLSQPRHKGP
jgi:cyclomaltodextrinase